MPHYLKLFAVTAKLLAKKYAEMRRVMPILRPAACRAVKFLAIMGHEITRNKGIRGIKA